MPSRRLVAFLQEERIFDRLTPAPEPPLKIIPSSVYQ